MSDDLKERLGAIEIVTGVRANRDVLGTRPIERANQTIQEAFARIEALEAELAATLDRESATQKRHDERIEALEAERDKTIDPYHVKGPDGVVRTLDEHYDGQGDVEQDPYGAWLAIQNMSARIEALEAEKRELSMDYLVLGSQTQEALERAERAEAERDAAVVAAYEKAANLCSVLKQFPQLQQIGSTIDEDLADDIRALTPADALTALDAFRAKHWEAGRKEGLREAAQIAKTWLELSERPEFVARNDGRHAAVLIHRDILAATEGGD